HVERAGNELTGASDIVASALGRKVGPKLPRWFSDTVFAYRVGRDFYWSTMTENVVTKNRALPLADKLPPDFGQIVAAYRKRVAALTPATTTEAPVKTA